MRPNCQEKSARAPISEGLSLACIAPSYSQADAIVSSVSRGGGGRMMQFDSPVDLFAGRPSITPDLVLLSADLPAEAMHRTLRWLRRNMPTAVLAVLADGVDGHAVEQTAREFGAFYLSSAKEQLDGLLAGAAQTRRALRRTA